MFDRSALASLQQLLLFMGAAVLAVWIWWIWPHSPVAAVAVAFASVTGHAWVLAAEFFLIPVLRAGDTTPCASAAELIRAWMVEVVHAWRVFAWRQPFHWRSIPDVLHGPRVHHRTGVVLIHGIICNRGFWTPWLQKLNTDGRAFVAVNLEPVFTGIDDYVDLLEQAVIKVEHSTGRPPLLVCHSMGGLVARAWLRRTDVARIERVVTIGSPHSGTWYARFSLVPNGRDMDPNGPWMARLNGAWTRQQAARFTCWYSNCDNIVQPPAAATLEGADNRLVRGAAHIELAFHPEVIRGTLAMLRDDATADSLTCDSGSTQAKQTWD